MFLSYEMLATFGISMVVSFTLSMAVLLAVLARRGYFRLSSAGRVYGTVEPALKPHPANQAGSPLLVTPSAPPLAMVVELQALTEKTERPY